MPIDENAAARGHVERGNQSDHGRFACARWADQRRYSSRLRYEADIMQDGFSGVIRKVGILEYHLPVNAAQPFDAIGTLVLEIFVQNFTRAFEPGKSFCDLRA